MMPEQKTGEAGKMCRKCYECKWRRSIPGDAHSRCISDYASVKGHPQGIRGGWFHWPYNFDPTWLVECDGFVDKSEVQS